MVIWYPHTMNERAPLYAFLGGIGLVTIGALLLGRRRSEFPGAGRPSLPATVPATTGAVQKAIVAEANRQGVNPAVALLFADVESGFQAGAVGDKNWPYRGDNWERFVLNNPRLQGNPYLMDRELWVSYGVYQLLAPFHLHYHDPMANPRSLLNLNTNVRVGVAKIKRLLSKYGDPLAARMAYVCGSPSACSTSRAELIASRLESKAGRWNIYLGSDAMARAREMAVA